MATRQAGCLDRHMLPSSHQISKTRTDNRHKSYRGKQRTCCTKGKKNTQKESQHRIAHTAFETNSRLLCNETRSDLEHTQRARYIAFSKPRSVAWSTGIKAGTTAGISDHEARQSNDHRKNKKQEQFVQHDIHSYNCVWGIFFFFFLRESAEYSSWQHQVAAKALLVVVVVQL